MVIKIVVFPTKINNSSRLEKLQQTTKHKGNIKFLKQLKNIQIESKKKTNGRLQLFNTNDDDLLAIVQNARLINDRLINF